MKVIYETKRGVVLGDNNNCLMIFHLEDTEIIPNETYPQLTIEVRSRIDTQFSNKLSVWGISKENIQGMIKELQKIETLLDQ